MDLSRSIPGAEMILERSDNVRKISSLKEVGTISEPGQYSVDVRYAGTGLLGSSSLRSLRMLFSYKPKDGEAQNVEQKICEQSPHGHHMFTVDAGQTVRWSLEVKSGSLAKGLPVRATIQKIQSPADHLSEGSASPSEVHAVNEYVGSSASPAGLAADTTEAEPVEVPASQEEVSFASDEAHVTEPKEAPPPVEAAQTSAGDADEAFDDWAHVDVEEDEEEEVEEVVPEDEGHEADTHGASDVVWKEQASLKRGRDAERSTPLLAGFYRLLLQKTDNLAGPKRIISCTLKLTRQADGTLIKQHTREVGGFKAGRKLFIDFAVKEEDAPAVFHLRAETNAAARVVPVKLSALIVCFLPMGPSVSCLQIARCTGARMNLYQRSRSGPAPFDL